MTYEQEFVAVRHESDLLTPLFHAPLVSLSVRELGYLGAFVICAMLSLAGSAPPWLAAAGLALAAAAFFRWRGETPEMYLYYAALAALESPRGAGRGRGRSSNPRPRRRSRRRGALDALLGRGANGRGANGRLVVGPGTEHALGSGAQEEAPPPRAGGGSAAAERILVAGAPGGGGAGGPYDPAAPAPVDLTLDLGASRAHAGVAVLVDGAELVRDTANGEGLLTVTMIPRAGLRRIDVVDAATGGEIASHTVEFFAGSGGGGGEGGGRAGVGG